MFNQRECRTEIPQCHMAVTWSPLSPFVLCQKQGSESVLPLNKLPFFCVNAAAVLKLFITRAQWRGGRVNLDLQSVILSEKPPQRDQKSVRMVHVLLYYTIFSHFILTFRSNLIRRVNWGGGGGSPSYISGYDINNKKVNNIGGYFYSVLHGWSWRSGQSILMTDSVFLRCWVQRGEEACN